METISSILILDGHAYATELVGMTMLAMLSRNGKKEHYSGDGLHIVALFRQEVRHA
jgi:hypothetical protein